MSDVIHAIDLAILLISENQENINGTTGLDREMLCAITAKNLVTLLDSVGVERV